jgi:hypothetical protein
MRSGGPADVRTVALLTFGRRYPRKPLPETQRSSGSGKTWYYPNQA